MSIGDRLVAALHRHARRQLELALGERIVELNRAIQARRDAESAPVFTGAGEDRRKSTPRRTGLLRKPQPLEVSGVGARANTHNPHRRASQ